MVITDDTDTLLKYMTEVKMFVGEHESEGTDFSFSGFLLLIQVVL